MTAAGNKRAGEGGIGNDRGSASSALVGAPADLAPPRRLAEQRPLRDQLIDTLNVIYNGHLRDEAKWRLDFGSATVDHVVEVLAPYLSVTDDKATEPPVDRCGRCHALVYYVECPTGSWWAHLKHPADDHDAVVSDSATIAAQPADGEEPVWPESDASK